MVSQSLSSGSGVLSYSFGDAAVAIKSVPGEKQNAESRSDDQHLGAAQNRESRSSNVDFKEKTISAAGAAFLSAVIVNPLDVAKTRLQAQAAGVQYQNPQSLNHQSLNHQAHEGKCPPVCPRGGPAQSVPLCPPDCFRYKSTWDVFYKVVRQEGFLRLWRGTDAALAIAVPTVGIYLPCYDIFREGLEDFSRQKNMHLEPYAPFVAGTVARSIACIVCGPIELARTRMQAHKEVRQGVSPPGIWATMTGATLEQSGSSLKRIRALWTGVGAQLARDVPFSAICWSTLEPSRRHILQRVGSDTASNILAANFGSGVFAGCIAAAATCPLDVIKTRRQILDPSKRLDSSTAMALLRIWREEGVRGLFTGLGPRVARTGPSVGIVVSFYEVMKYFIHNAAEKH